MLLGDRKGFVGGVEGACDPPQCTVLLSAASVWSRGAPGVAGQLEPASAWSRALQAQVRHVDMWGKVRQTLSAPLLPAMKRSRSALSFV